VGAGYSVSDTAGDFATITKLVRVLMLIPAFFVLVMVYHDLSAGPGKLPFPWFILGFVVCLGVASMNWLPAVIVEQGNALSRFCLVTAIAALGMKTKPAVLIKGSGPAVAMVVIETLFLGAIILIWVTSS